MVLTGGKSGAAFLLKRWVLDAWRGIQYLSGFRGNKAYKGVCIEGLSDDILRTNSNEFRRVGSFPCKDEMKHAIGDRGRGYGISTPRCYLH